MMHTEDSCVGSHGNLFPPPPPDGSSSAQGWLPDKGRWPCEELEETSLCTELTWTVLLQGRRCEGGRGRVGLLGGDYHIAGNIFLEIEDFAV